MNTIKEITLSPTEKCKATAIMISDQENNPSMIIKIDNSQAILLRHQMDAFQVVHVMSNKKRKRFFMKEENNALLIKGNIYSALDILEYRGLINHPELREFNIRSKKNSEKQISSNFLYLFH